MLLPILQSFILNSGFENKLLETKNLSNFNPKFELNINVIPQKDTNEIAPVIDAKAAIAIDPNSSTVLFAKNINEKLAFASIAKLMTAIIVIEENDLDEIVTINKAAQGLEDSRLWLSAGEQISIRNMITLMLISSANDVALKLAEYNAGSEEQFVEKMNQKAQILGLKNTSFQNPIGFDDDSQKSTVEDLANLAKYALQKPLIKRIVSQKSMIINSENGIIHEASSTNKLLGTYLNVIGVKTGTTDEAGECLIALATKNGTEVLTVILGSQDRFQETKSLLDWVYQSYKW